MPLANPGLSRIDSIILFSTIRRQKPKKIIEIGSGFSTKVILSALDFNKKELNLCKLISVEPYPKTFLKEIERSDFQLLTEKIQQLKLSYAWRWGHTQDHEREIVRGMILQSLGLSQIEEN